MNELETTENKSRLVLKSILKRGIRTYGLMKASLRTAKTELRNVIVEAKNELKSEIQRNAH